MARRIVMGSFDAAAVRMSRPLLLTHGSIHIEAGSTHGVVKARRVMYKMEKPAAISWDVEHRREFTVIRPEFTEDHIVGFSGEMEATRKMALVKDEGACKEFDIWSFTQHPATRPRKAHDKHRNTKTRRWEIDRRECKRLHQRRDPVEFEIKDYIENMDKIMSVPEPPPIVDYWGLYF